MNGVQTCALPILLIFIILIIYPKIIIGVGIIQGQFLRISTTAAAIWQQMMKIPEILAILKRNNHSKRKAGEVLMSQLRDYQLHQPPYDTSYIHNFDVPLKWWKTCQMDPPYLQYLAVKLF